jgi:RNA polymerase sigma-70 factor (ECF subfamily)
MQGISLAEHGAMAVISGSACENAEGDEGISLVPRVDEVNLAREHEDSGRILQGCRQYLLMIANDVIGPEIQAKVGASDLVQETFVEAQRHLAEFRGRSRAELRAWLRKILECRLSNLRRSYLATEKRDARREVTIETLVAGSNGDGDILASRSPSPSNHAVQAELRSALDRALVRLPEHYRQAVVWRHHEQLSWDEIGRRIGCTADAARKVWGRAIRELRRELAGFESMP